MAEDRRPDYRPGMEVFRMDSKAEKTVPFSLRADSRPGHRTSPRGELTRRAQEIAARTYDIPIQTNGGFRRYAAGLGAALP